MKKLFVSFDYNKFYRSPLAYPQRKMELISSRMWPFALMSILLVSMCILSDCYDPLDPNGNITVTFDIYEWKPDGYSARVTIQNYYQYRHVDKPGWQLGWTWANNEVILSMAGAFATQQGNCTDFKFQNPIPHSCKKDPTIMDLTPEASPDNKSEHCCRGGMLAAWTINPSMSSSSFEITVGNLNGNDTEQAPLNLTLMAPGPGYTCGPLLDTAPTVSLVIGGQREVQVFRTWKSTCTYSSFLANKIPVCCASLSTFYSPTITGCHQCSCGCKEAVQSTVSCIREGNPISASDLFSNLTVVQCSDHMCPVRVHWHFKNNYMNYWRVKLTISNFNYAKNYSDWNVLVQHPGFGQSAKTYNFNSMVLPSIGISDEVSLFWGLEYYNSELLHADEKQVGSVTTDILLKKDPDSFTLSNGWAFPRRIYFNGENCEMPLPDTFPMLPNGSSSKNPSHPHLFFLLVVCLIFNTLDIYIWL